MINKASKLYNELLNIYTTQYDKVSEDSKKRVNIQNIPEMLILDFDRDGLPPMPAIEGDEEVNLEPEETIAERTKLKQNRLQTN